MQNKYACRSFLGISLFILSSSLLGCSEAPEANEENGIWYADSESNESIQDIIQTDADEDDTYLDKVLDGDKCVCSIGDSEYVVKIDASVSGLDVETISIANAEPYPNAINKDKVIELFFGGEENVTETVPEENYSEQENTGETAILYRIEGSRQMFLDSVDGKIHFYQTSDAGFYYTNDELISKYLQIEKSEGYFENQNVDISDSYTVSMAKQDLLETLSQILDEEVRILSCTALSDGTGSGYYEFTFVPVLDGVPMVINDRSSDSDNIVDVYGRVQIGEDGIAVMEANNFLWKNQSVSDASDVISFGKILKILEEYTKTGEIKGSKNYTFTRATLAWLPVTENWTEAELVPVWRFYIPVNELVELEMVEDAATDICLNAITGEIERVEY